ncbi:MAG TPA: hypothetical protein VLC49_13145 [Solirubrobacteraceae bacterium]|nr:hypothetical protein [Solirubrobacteraceae bacterium]
MSEVSNTADLVGLEPDERLLHEDLSQLPEAVGRPATVIPSRARGRIVGTGATLTAVSLLAGVLLVALGVIDAVSSGVDLAAVLALVVGGLLIATHWGWVHVAEITANSVEGHSNAEVVDRRRQWLAAIEPYPRLEVSTEVGDDGSIAICTVRHSPVRVGEGRFTFVRELQQREVHSADEPAAAVTERAETLRREAAIVNEEERRRYEIASEAYHAALIGRADDEQRRLARRAASEALSHQINSNLRDPPLVE